MPCSLPLLQQPNLLPNKQRSHSRSSPDTHTHHPEFLPRPLQLRQKCGQLPRTRRTQRMSQSNASALWIHLFLFNPQFSCTIDRLTCKRFIDLPNAHILDLDTSVFHEFGDGDGGTDAHFVGRATDGYAVDPFADDGGGEAEGVGGAAFHE